MVLLADVQERHQLAFYLLKLGSILLVGIFQMLERTTWVDIVAGIDAHLLAVEGSHIGRMGREMDIGHKGCQITVGLQTGRDMLHVLCLTRSLGGEAHQFATSVDDALGLGHTALRIVGIHRRHRLDTDGIGAANADASDTGLRTNSSYTHTSVVLIPRWLSRS